jgi:hypothetical protein
LIIGNVKRAVFLDRDGIINHAFYIHYKYRERRAGNPGVVVGSLKAAGGLILQETHTRGELAS